MQKILPGLPSGSATWPTARLSLLTALGCVPLSRCHRLRSDLVRKLFAHAAPVCRHADTTTATRLCARHPTPASTPSYSSAMSRGAPVRLPSAGRLRACSPVGRSPRSESSCTRVRCRSRNCPPRGRPGYPSQQTTEGACAEELGEQWSRRGRSQGMGKRGSSKVQVHHDAVR